MLPARLFSIIPTLVRKGIQMRSPLSSLSAPLLPELQQPEGSSTGDSELIGSASVPGAVFNLSTSIIGAGIMSIPATVRVLGVVPALLLIAAVALLSDVSVEFLMRYAGTSAAGMSYAGVMRESFGRAGATVLQVCVGLTNMGALVMYSIIIGDVVSGSRTEGAIHTGVLVEWFGAQWWNTRTVVLLLTLLIVVLPLTLLRRVDSLRFTSAISVLLAVVFVCISSALALFIIFKGTAQPPWMFPDIRHKSVFELFTTIPVIVVAFTFHFNVHPIRAELKKNSDMKIAVRVALFTCSVIYAATGIFCYLLFGDSTMSDVLSNFDNTFGSHISPILNNIVRLSYVLHLVLVYPLLFYSLRLNVDGLIFPKIQNGPINSLRFVSLTGFLIVLILLAAIAIPNIWTVFQFLGSTTAVCLSLIFPGAIVLRDVRGISNRSDKILATTMIVLAVITSCLAIASNLISTFSGKKNVGSTH